ncbi:MAG: Holliday junction branch migration protein RuvA [Gammaproteobacteria bacterium]|nr:Holliday junction branch migration protein RuvA [Gammaproteobacteria bacterium]MCY4226537.1 Holliday junction branch migration protein RuvA [Gammaproteobacteria bacterium]MCY4312559.1 Holliday junction branch migration protein RuvA [Gammaproteobacteria bacterium]
MIGYLHGRLIYKVPPNLLVDVNGVGYELEAPMSTIYNLPDEGETVSLFVHMVVREDAQLLFGFSELSQRELFRILLKINGIGPKVGLAILSTLSIGELLGCIRNRNHALLTRVPGIGKKTAERMILEMKDLLKSMQVDDSSELPDDENANDYRDAVSALIALGFRASEAETAVAAVRETSETRDDLIRNALAWLSEK